MRNAPKMGMIVPNMGVHNFPLFTTDVQARKVNTQPIPCNFTLIRSL